MNRLADSEREHRHALNVLCVVLARACDRRGYNALTIADRSDIVEALLSLGAYDDENNIGALTTLEVE